jgi:hypothetical protein
MASKMSSVLVPGNQNVVIQDCDRNICDSPNVVAARMFSKLAQKLVPSGAVLTASALQQIQFRGVLPVGFGDDSNTTYAVVTTPPELATNFSLFDTDQKDLDAYAQTNVATSATVWTALSPELDRDYTVTGAPSGTRMRPFGYFIVVTVPESVGRIQITDDNAAGLRYSSFDIPASNCLQLAYFLPFRDTSVLYNGKLIGPTDPTNLYYRIPPAGVGGILAPGAGTAKVPGIRCFDLSGTQVPANVIVQTWRVNYTDTLAAALFNGSTLGGIEQTPIEMESYTMGDSL